MPKMILHAYLPSVPYCFQVKRKEERKDRHLVQHQLAEVEAEVRCPHACIHTQNGLTPSYLSELISPYVCSWTTTPIQGRAGLLVQPGKGYRYAPALYSAAEISAF